ncbi:MAG TPA: extracellular solute-binding protein [Limnochordia bacterium]|nr:extracellular solute-binding protein [Limnochordia bacterium]
MQKRAKLALLPAIALLGSGITAQAATKLVYWDWHAPRANLVQKYAKQYEALHPDVQIDVQVQSGDFEAKLATAISAGSPPDISQVHNSWVGRLVSGLTPYPETMFPGAQLRADNALFDMVSTLQGKVYFLPEGIMAAGIYYNTDALAEAGLEKPALDWANFTNQAKKLVEKDSTGKISRAGFDFSAGNFQWLWSDINYQEGGFLFGKDGGVTFNSPQSQAAWQIELNLLKAGVDNPKQGMDFAKGQAAMKYNWTWYAASAAAAKDLNYSVSMVPTPTGKSVPARGRNNAEIGMAVPVAIPENHKSEAFRFIKWLFGNADFMTELNVALGTIPTQRALWNRPEFTSAPSFRMLTQEMQYTVFPGPVDNWYWDLLTKVADRLKAGEPLASVLPSAQEQGDAQFKATPPPDLTERLYEPPAK